MSKASSRIPTFRSSLPQIKRNLEVSIKDLGKKVRVVDKEGILRFIGSVHFSSGIWCGVELPTSLGKNDGVVQGIRYFKCPPGCGLMVPLSKVFLFEPITNEFEDSGPFSMLFIKDDGRLKGENEWKEETAIEKPSSLPHLKNKFNKIDFEDSMVKKLQFTDDEGSKRDSLELDESLGILTPEQMADGMTFNPLINSRTNTPEKELPSPNVTDFSLGIIDEHLISNLTLKTDTTMNMELPLDKSNVTRLEQTPSPEDLPLDPTPVVDIDPKTDPNKSKTSSSFITSITSITSLDTGYQGDGEMSRPASRGPDNSPLTRRPLPRPQTRRTDPMTDSDFYTESDADNHEENPLRGDRKAQVIDGTLYGVDPQAAADIYVNNRENMDSSGIFTDIENTRNEDLVVDVSPSDISSKTISGNSQSNLQEILDKKDEKESKKRNGSPIVRSPRHKDEAKKYKTPKIEATSKVKAMLESSPSSVKRSVKKPVGKWDAVMNKISKSGTKTNLKEVKSRVFNDVRPSEQRKNVRQPPSQKAATPKTRRIRRIVNTTPKPTTGSSIHSSLSDLSASTSPPKTPGISKKREVVQVTQVLTPSKLSPKPIQSNLDSKKVTELKNKLNRSSPLSKDKKQSIKECGRASVKGGRTSPIVRPPNHTRAPAKPVPKVAEALAVLVQHLVFNVEAYQVPALKREVQKFRNEAEQIRLACQHLEENLAEERTKRTKAVEEEREKCAKEIEDLVEKHRLELLDLNSQQSEFKRRMNEESEDCKNAIMKQNEEKLLQVKVEFRKLQKTHEESLDILREENDAVREQIDERDALIEEARYESLKLKEDYETKEIKLKEQLQSLKIENCKLKQEFWKLEEKFKDEQDEGLRLRQENERLLNYGDNKGLSVQELQSLRVVLELKQNEVAELRKALAEANQKNEILTGAEERAAAAIARCEDLQHQLERKSEYEQNLLAEKKKLLDSFKEEIHEKKRLTRYNEELQWKLKQNIEVVSKVLEQAAEETSFNRSSLNASFSERHSSSNSLERTLSYREKSSSDISPPTSPKVKGVVEKSDWVSYVLDLDESPEIVASRIVRRSFRNSTPPKTTPTKLSNSKRPRTRNALSLSASASAILPSDKPEYCRSVSTSWVTSTPKHHDDLDLDDEEIEMNLPALPSEIGRTNETQALPSPKHLAGEAMISESNSEDESTSSSSVQL